MAAEKDLLGRKILRADIIPLQIHKSLCKFGKESIWAEEIKLMMKLIIEDDGRKDGKDDDVEEAGWWGLEPMVRTWRLLQLLSGEARQMRRHVLVLTLLATLQH